MSKDGKRATESGAEAMQTIDPEMELKLAEARVSELRKQLLNNGEAAPKVNGYAHGADLTEQLDKKTPRSLPIAKAGVRTGRDFANLMGALVSDLIEGRITPEVGNAACNAGGKLLKVVEMEYKYGATGTGVGEKVLKLTGEIGA